jgi:hypothetical protein
MQPLRALFICVIAGTTISSLAAEPLPFGCYVTDEERSLYQVRPTCYAIQETSYSFLTPANTSAQGLVDAYGNVAAALIMQGYDTDIARLQCLAAFKSKTSLERRLRKACGSKCKRVK